MTRETSVDTDHLIHPFFIIEGRGRRVPVASMPGVERLSVDQLVKDARASAKLGIPAVLLFGVPSRKDARGSGADDPKGLVQTATRALKDALPDLAVITDACLCEYTDHGHCGPLGPTGVDNDAALERLRAVALSQAEAGADMVAPSGMMDGAVKAIRSALDEAGRTDVAIMAYAAKFASAFYGPFRDAASSAPAFGDRRGYQMDPANRREALREVSLDVAEGADVVMVKPALAYLDIVREVRDRFSVPVAAYNVSGEYAMVKAAAAKGWVDGAALAREILLSIRRAGADMIITYHAADAAREAAR
jgi:porphobilinogen synthase